MKDKTIALILSVLVGGLGIDRFYLGYTGMGVLKLLTGGCFGVLWIIDIVNIATGKLLPADGSGYANQIDAAPAPSNVAPAASAESVEEKLTKLAALHNQGILSDEEFARAKADLLSKM